MLTRTESSWLPKITSSDKFIYSIWFIIYYFWLDSNFAWWVITGCYQTLELHQQQKQTKTETIDTWSWTEDAPTSNGATCSSRHSVPFRGGTSSCEDSIDWQDQTKSFHSAKSLRLFPAEDISAEITGRLIKAVKRSRSVGCMSHWRCC